MPIEFGMEEIEKIKVGVNGKLFRILFEDMYGDILMLYLEENEVKDLIEKLNALLE